MSKYAALLNAIKQIQMELTAIAVRCSDLIAEAEALAKRSEKSGGPQ